MLPLPAYQIQKSVLQPIGSQRKLIPASRFRITGKHVEHGGRILADWLRTGQKPHIRIQFCRRIVVVAGSQMHIPSDAVLFSSDHQGYLAVGLKPYQTINDMTARFLQFPGPDNIIFLIKPGL